MPERERFGDFLLHERLAVGGMGELYLATRAERRSPPFALKIMARSYRENAEFVSMFQDEARIGMRLSHSNIVGVSETGFADFTAYIVMEYVHGENLRHVLRVMDKLGERIPPALAVKLAIDVLRGLDHAHKAVDENGNKLHLVHRDLSPDNILVSYEGEVKLLDFGIAKAEGRTTTTQVGVVKGKPQYMSPEQAKARIVDARSDLFSAAVVLRELLTGERRFPDDDLRWESARNWMPKATPGIPYELDAILLRALEPEPAHRYQTADEMAGDLTRIARSGTLPRAKESLPTLLKRLFPQASARKFDSTDVTILKPEPPRWETEEQERTRAELGRADPIGATNLNLATGSATVPMAPMFGSIDAGPSVQPLRPPENKATPNPLMPPPRIPVMAKPSPARMSTPPPEIPPDDDPTAPAADLANMATSPGVVMAPPPEAERDRNTARSPRIDEGRDRNTARSPRARDDSDEPLFPDRRHAIGVIAAAVALPATLAGVFAIWKLWPGEQKTIPTPAPTATPKPVRTATPRPKPTRRPVPKKTPKRR